MAEAGFAHDQATSQGRDSGSFRDPAGYVFEHDGQVFRAVADSCYQVLKQLADAGLLAAWQRAGLLVGTSFVADPALQSALQAAQAPYQHFLQHDRVWPIVYPYEWCLSMLVDAGLATLDLQEKLLDQKLALKDATAYNVQFARGRPVFIDVSSIEKPKRLDLWYALGQFNSMFFFPALLCRDYGWDLRSYFLGSLGGRTLEQMGRSLGKGGLSRPRAILDITLPLWLQKRSREPAGNGNPMASGGSDNTSAQRFNLGRLRRKLTKLAKGYRTAGVWSQYTQTCSYVQQAEQAKKDHIGQYLEQHRPAAVLDLGCNTGDYSLLAAQRGAQVVAVDGDHDAIELLYRRLKEKPAAVTPMVVDLGNPSPAIGFRNRERKSFEERIQADCVFALALLHHLLVSGNLSLYQVRDLLHDLTRQHLILEFVPPDDVMFRRLLAFRTDSFAGLDLPLVKRIFGERFDLVQEWPIADSPRTLLAWRKKSTG